MRSLVDASGNEAPKDAEPGTRSIDWKRRGCWLLPASTRSAVVSQMAKSGEATWGREARPLQITEALFSSLEGERRRCPVKPIVKISSVDSERLSADNEFMATSRDR